MTQTVEMQTQILQAVRDLLRLRLAGVVKPEGVLAGWNNPNMTGQLDTQKLNPVVGIWFGPTVPAHVGGTNGTGSQSSRNILPVDTTGFTILQPDGSTVSYEETARKNMQMNIGIVAAGPQAKPLRQQVRSLIDSTFRRGLSVAISDSLETINVVDPNQTQYGLTAQVTLISETPNDTLDLSQRNISEYHFIYNVEYSDYEIVSHPVVAATQTYVVVE